MAGTGIAMSRKEAWPMYARTGKGGQRPWVT